MRRCRKCMCVNEAACRACRSYYRGRVKNALIIAFVMCVGAMLLGCILALLMIGVFYYYKPKMRSYAGNRNNLSRRKSA